ncbi:hypothetical protein XENOCAPTIV_007749, partial [Xenoophorus captivus]
YESNVAVRDRVAFACMFLSDVQGSPSDVLKDPRVQCWIENYRNLLDAWRFWHKRAEFDILRGKLDPSSKPLAQTAGEHAVIYFTFIADWSLSALVYVYSWQVFVSCNFCGKSISYSCSAMPHQGRGFSQYGVSGSPTKSKVTSCPGCRKPLPRCALCLMNMGTPVSSCSGRKD